MAKNSSYKTRLILSLPLVAMILNLSGCILPKQTTEELQPALVLAPLSRSGNIDARAKYRKTFCNILASESDLPCNEFLQKLPDELEDDLSPASFKTAQKATIFFISGIFSECFPKLLLFGESRDRLKKNGFTLIDIPVSGRASAEANSEIIYETISRWSGDIPSAYPKLVVSYSKGTVDLLTALNRFEDLSKKVDAVISFAGAVNGSPLADSLERLYANTFALLPIATCEKNDKHELKSLSKEERLIWNAKHKLPSRIKYFSVVATPSADRVSTGLIPFYKELGKFSWRNDGQVIAYDAIIPGSSVLGYLNADHFAISLPITEWSHLVGALIADKNYFPRHTALLSAIIVALEELH